jgi:peptide/nickel transport system substrate-binding protein
VVKLRKGVLFHNGKEFTAEDAKWSIERLQAVSPNKGDYTDIVRVDIRDPYTIAVVLKGPSPILPAILAGPWGGYIMPKDLDKAQGGTISKPIGTGPFQWVQWDSGRRLIIRKYAQYKPDTRFPGPTGLGGKREALVDEIEFRVVPEGATRASSTSRC